MLKVLFFGDIVGKLGRECFFDILPELHWKYGYLLSVGMMIISSILPVYIFKRKGWI